VIRARNTMASEGGNYPWGIDNGSVIKATKA